MKKVVPLIRLAFLALFFLLLRKGLLLVWLGIYLASLLLPLLWGKRLYCLLACPMNTVMSLLSKIKAKTGRRNHPVPAWLRGDRLVFASLALTIVVFIVSRKVIGKDFPMMIVWIVVSILTVHFFHPDVFHDKVCPFGLPQGCAAKVSLLDTEAREKARDYQGFTKSVLGGQPENPGTDAPAPLA